MNTLWADRSGVHDDLATPGDLAAWLAAVGLPVDAGPADLDAAHRLRDALRRAAAAVTGDDRPRARAGMDDEAAARTVSDALAQAPGPARLVRTAAGWEVRAEPPRTAAQALALVAAEGARLVSDPTGPSPLRACHAPGCVLYFVKDHPRREWCSTTCGNRARAARHYARIRSAD